MKNPLKKSMKKLINKLMKITWKKFLNANIVIELVIWRQIVLISILVNIVARRIIHQKNVRRETSLQDQRFTMGGSILGNEHQQPRNYINFTEEYNLE